MHLWGAAGLGTLEPQGRFVGNAWRGRGGLRTPGGSQLL